MNFRELLYISNLVSLSRVALVPVAGYLLYLGDFRSSLYCLGVIIFAGLTDALDGYLARKLNQVSQLGLILDPLTDKIFAISLVIMLLIFREFPIYLAVAIFARDFVILLAGLFLLKENVVVPSNEIGKYYFASLVTLISCTIVSFPLGIEVMTWIFEALYLMSVVSYFFVLVELKRKKKQFSFPDNIYIKVFRITATYLLGIYILYNFYIFLEI